MPPGVSKGTVQRPTLGGVQRPPESIMDRPSGAQTARPSGAQTARPNTGRPVAKANRRSMFPGMVPVLEATKTEEKDEDLDFF